MQSHCILNNPCMLSHASPVIRSRPARAVPCRSAIQQKQQTTSPTSAPAKQSTQADALPKQQRPEIVQQHVPLSQQQQDAILPQPGRISPLTDSKSLIALDNWAEDYAMPDEMSLWDADGDYYSSRRDLQLAYLPPKSDVPGAAVALSLIVCWVRSRTPRHNVMLSIAMQLASCCRMDSIVLHHQNIVAFVAHMSCLPNQLIVADYS
jgi:hypothetical protein